MSEPILTPVSVGMEEVKLRSLLIFGTIFVFASIVFGILYLFVLAPSAPGSSAGWFLFSFATGITMIVMPCTLPLAFVIVPLSMGKGVAKGLGISLAFGIGIAITQSMYGVIAALIGSYAIGALGAPLENVKNWVYLFAGTFAFLFALGEIGLIKVKMPTYTGAAPAFIQRRQDVVKALLLGLFLGNIGIGCPHPATPLLLIEAASSGSVVYGWLLFMTHAIGRVLPLLLLSFMGILGVNGLNWLMARKEGVERATGWAMVFVAGFILTLGLFTHNWWVNSGIHSALESVTQEHYFNQQFNHMLNTSVQHVHGLESGTAMFGLPLWLGNWFLVAVWVLPMWWWWSRKRKALYHSPVFRLREIEARIDRLEKSRRDIEDVIKLDDIETDFDLSSHRTQIDALEKARRDAEEKVQFAEKGIIKEPIVRTYESRILSMQRNYLVVLTGFLALTFIYFLPTNFYLKGMAGGHGHTTAAMSSSPYSPLSTSTAGLPDATETKLVRLNDGDSYVLTASYVKKEVGNRTLRMLAYNGSVPGPLISAAQGSTVKVTLINNTDLDQTIHSHGVRVDNLNDGTPGVTQDVVKPGARYTYTVTFKDAGVFWYHPHTRDDIGQEMGLYGNYIIDATSSDYWSKVNREIPLVVDDILIENNQLANFYRETTTNALLGRIGNEFLVNGEENYALSIRKGEVARFFVTNVSNSRTYKLSIPGIRMKVVGADAGRYEKEFFSDSILLSPAERIVVEAYFPESGNFHLTHATPNGTTTLATFVVGEGQVSNDYKNIFETARENKDVQNEFSTFRDKLSSAPDKRLRLVIDPESAKTINHGGHSHGATPSASSATTSMTMMPDGTMMTMSSMMGGKTGIDAVQWDDIGNTDTINTTKNITWRIIDEDTGKSNGDIDVSTWTFKVGSLVKIAIKNDANALHTMQHPIHLHGQRFVVLTKNGVPNDNMVWKDTVLVLPGETVEILVDMSNPGVWMLHCHIVEHLFAGMMFNFRVENQDGTAAGDEYRKNAGKRTETDLSIAKSSSYSYTSTVDSKGYKVTKDAIPLTNGKVVYTTMTFEKDGKPVNLSSSINVPLRVYFVKNDNSSTIETWIGKIFTAPVQAQPTVDPESLPHGHQMMMGELPTFAFINTAEAHNAVQDGHPNLRNYSVPVLFGATGTYRAFVEFIPEGSNEVITATFDTIVDTPSFSVNNFGWSVNQKWWILFIISLLLMVPLITSVRRYINVKNI